MKDKKQGAFNVGVDADVIQAEVNDLPTNIEYWMLVGRYEIDDNYYSAGILHRNKIDAEAQQQQFRFKDAKIIRIILPV